MLLRVVARTACCALRIMKETRMTRTRTFGFFQLEMEGGIFQSCKQYVAAHSETAYTEVSEDI